MLTIILLSFCYITRKAADLPKRVDHGELVERKRITEVWGQQAELSAGSRA